MPNTDKELGVLHRRCDDLHKALDLKLGDVAVLTQTVADLARTMIGLQSKVAAIELRPQPVAAAKPVVHAEGLASGTGARVVDLSDLDATTGLPDLNESRQLLDIIYARFPRLKPEPSPNRLREEEEPREIEAFRAALGFVCSRKKTAHPVTRYAVSWWIDAAEGWARRARMPNAGLIGSFGSLLPALITAGVTFDSGSSIWLSDGVGDNGVVIDRNSWRKVLGGHLLEPSRIAFDSRGIGFVREVAS